MKRIFLFLILCLSFAVVSCNWHIPEKVTVKQNATYKFSAGTIEPKLGLDFNFKEMIQEALSPTQENSTFVFYDYNPDGKSKGQQFAARMAIAEVPIDFGDFLENSGLNSAVKDLSFDQKIEIPKINIEFKKEIPSDDIKKGVNAAVSYANGEFLSKFEYVEYNSLTLNLMGVQDGDYDVAITSGGKTKYGHGNSIDCGNFKIIHNDFKVEVNGSPFTGPVTVSASSDPKIIKGLTSEIPIQFDFNVNFSATGNDPTSFEKCTIKEGSLKTNVNVPNSWSGVDISYDFTATGAMTLEEKIKDKKDINLAETIITSGETAAKVNAKALVNNATIDFGSSLNMEITSDIKTLSEITVNIKDFKSEIDEKTELPQEMKDSVKEIDLLASGLSLVYTNTLPPGNPIKLKVNSNFIGLNDKTKDLECGKTNEKIEILSDYNENNTKKVVIENSESVDFKIDVSLPGATSENKNHIVLKDVSFGDVYEISMQIEPVINWQKIVLSSGLAESLSQKDKIELPFDLTGIFDSMGDLLGDDFKENVKLNEIPIYLFCTKPTASSGENDPFKDAKFTGSIKLYYGKKDGEIVSQIGTEINLTENENGKIEFKPSPKLKFDEKDKNVLITNFKEEDFSAHNDLADLFNQSLDGTIEKGSSIFVDYDLTFQNGNSGEIKIEKSMVGDDGGSIGVFAVVVLPLEFTADKNIKFDATKLAGDSFSQDLFGRKSADDLSDFKTFTDYIDEVNVGFKGEKLPFYGPLKINFDINCGTKDDGTPKEIVPLITEKSTLKEGGIGFSKDDLVNKILANYPSTPSISLEVEKNEPFGISREAGLAMKLTLEIVTDCEIPVLGGTK